MVALAVAYVKIRADTSGLKGDIDRGLRGAGGQKAAHAQGKSIGQSFSKGFGDGGSTFGRVAAIMASKATIIGGSLAAATPLAAKFVAALAPATGAVVGLIPAVTTLAAVQSTLNVAVGDTFKVMSKGLSGAKGYADALDNLVPAQKAVVESVVAMKDEFDAVQNVVASNFFTPLMDDIKPLAGTFLPLVREELGGMAGELGRVTDALLTTARSAPVVQVVRDVFAASRDAVARLGGQVNSLVPALARLVSSSQPILRTMVGDVTSLTARFTMWANEAAKSGQLVGIFTRARVVILEVLRIIGNLGAITKAVFGPANRDAASFLRSLVELTRQGRLWVESAEGARVINRVFESMAATGGTLSKTLGGVLPYIASSLKTGAPAAAAFAAALGNMVVALGPLLPALVGVTAQLAYILIPAMNSLAGWLSRNQGLLQAIAPAVIAFMVASKVAAVAVGAHAIAIRAWAIIVGVAKAAMAGWTAINWLAVLPVHAHTAAMAASRSLIATWIGVKAIEARAWLSTTASTVASTASVVGHRIAMTASAVASKAAAVAQAAWTAVMAGSTAVMAAVRNGVLAINLAMRANPIGAVITVIGLLVGALVILYQRNETVRRVIDAVWAAIKTAIGAVGTWFTNTLMPSIKRAIDQGVTAFNFLRGIINTVWGWIKSYISLQVNIVLTVFRTLRTFVMVTIPGAFQFLVNAVRNYINIWRTIISTGWDFVRGKFTQLRDFITKTLPSAFATGVSAIGKAWAKVQEIARKPVAFVVNSVINPLIGGYNKIAGVFGGTKADPIRGFAQGGKIPGAPSSTDNRLAQLTGGAGRALGSLKVATGEFIVNAKDTAKALPLLHWVNSGMKGGPEKAAKYIGRTPAMMPGDGSEGWAFAKGGLVGFVKDVWSAVSDPKKLLEGPVKAAISRIPGAGPFKDMIAGMGNKLLSGLLNFVKTTGGGGGSWNGTIAPGQVGAVQKFVQAQAGKPYVWASAGPGGYDCSGIVSAAYNLLKGRNPYSHTFSTGSLPGRFFKPGTVGPLMAGWSHPGQSPASNSVGHMAGQIGGMPFESTGSRGVRVGGSARKITGFANRGAAMANGGLVNSSVVKLLDRGGAWESGRLGLNASGHTEHVLTGGPGGDMAELVMLLRQIRDGLQGIGPDLASAMSGKQRDALQHARTVGRTI